MNHSNVLTKTVMNAAFVTNQTQSYNAVPYSKEIIKDAVHPIIQKWDCNILPPKGLQTPGVRCVTLTETKGKPFGGI